MHNVYCMPLVCLGLLWLMFRRCMYIQICNFTGNMNISNKCAHLHEYCIHHQHSAVVQPNHVHLYNIMYIVFTIVCIYVEQNQSICLESVHLCLVNIHTYKYEDSKFWTQKRHLDNVTTDYCMNMQPTIVQGALLLNAIVYSIYYLPI